MVCTIGANPEYMPLAADTDEEGMTACTITHVAVWYCSTCLQCYPLPHATRSQVIRQPSHQRSLWPYHYKVY